MKKGIMDSIASRGVDTPAVEASRRFKGGSARHVAAMAGLPGSRRFEAAPLRYLLTESRSCLLDLFSGTGFASECVRGFFGETFLLEPHVASLADGSGNLHQRKVCALSAESFYGLPKADLAVCLAGFHHVLGPGSAEDRASHQHQRLEALRLWRSKLAPGGRLVIADVPAPRAETGWADGHLDGLVPVPEQEVGMSSFAGGCEPFDQARQCHGLGGYLARMTALCRELRLEEPEPAAFFNRVVSEQSPYGHVACFDSPLELADMFRQAGFEHVRAFVAPTPWLFPTKPDALWFVHELLGIGQPCGCPSDLPAPEQQALEAGIIDHLGLCKLPGGSWAVSWKLMYVTGDRP